MFSVRSLTCLIAAGLLAVLAACGDKADSTYDGSYDARTGRRTTDDDTKRDTVFGQGGIGLFGGRKEEDGGGGTGGIGVNSFLWRASLDTIAFMPLASADPFGGVIITDWYSPPATPDERFKVTIYILDRRLRADGIKVAVFKQGRGGGADWADTAVSTDTAINLENAILTRARELRVASAK